jgi:hypothetical protein
LLKLSGGTLEGALGPHIPQMGDFKKYLPRHDQDRRLLGHDLRAQRGRRGDPADIVRACNDADYSRNRRCCRRHLYFRCSGIPSAE